MILVENIGDGRHLGLRMDRKDYGDFQTEKHLVKGLISREWDPDKKLWIVPFNVIADLEKDSVYTPVKIAWSDNAVKTYAKWKGQINARISLKQPLEQPLELDGFFHAEQFPMFQQTAANFMYRNRRVILGDVVGLGKSVMGLAATAMGFKHKQYDKVVIVCPSNLIPKWGEDECGKFVSPPYYMTAIRKGNKVKSMDKAKRHKTYEAFKNHEGPAYLILGYGSLQHKEELKVLRKTLDSIRYAMIIDEVQRCKNYKAQQTKSTRLLADEAEHVYALSATYVEGRLEELHNVFTVVRPEVFGDFWHFSSRHIEYGDWGFKAYRKTDEIKTKKEPFVLRRLADDVDMEGALPDEVYIDKFVEMSPSQKALYNEISAKEEERILAESEYWDKEKMESVEMTRKAVLMASERQICLFPETVDPEVTDSPKFDVLVEHIDGIEESSKIVIFCFFQKAVELLGERLNEYWKTVWIHGGSGKNKEEVKAEFEDNPDVRILVTSDIFREGHDLVAARHMINYDLLWNPAHMIQRKGRLTRFSQKADQVIITTLITKGTVEEYIFDKILEPKRLVMNDMMDNNRESAKITREVVHHIHQNYGG